jgi:hypothetical protein
MTELSSTLISQQLPHKWIQRIFATLQGHYGSKFINMWKTGQILDDGTDAGIANAMEHWSQKLAGWVDKPETIKRTLQNLPPEPPTLPQFCELMRLNYVPKNQLVLTHQLSKEEIKEQRQKLKEILATLKIKGIDNDMEHG